MKSILNLSSSELAEEMYIIGEKKFRTKQIWQWLHQKRVDQYFQMTNVSKSLKEKLEENFIIRSLTTSEHQVSNDKLTEKWLFTSSDSSAMIESVLIRDIKGNRRTVCVSCMSGCPVGCVFCATGQGGFDRNLSTAEIIEQIYTVDKRCHEVDGKGISNIVFMGMGEPLLNLDNVLKACSILHDEEGMFIGGRKITISTAGIISGIYRLIELGCNYRLAISLHAPEQSLREKLIPIAAKWKLQDLIKALKEFSKVASRSITIEYCLMDKVNSSKKQARELVELLKGIDCKINLIPLNPTEECGYTAPPKDKIRAFQNTLESHGMNVLLREEKGQDIDAACGQLRAKKRDIL